MRVKIFVFAIFLYNINNVCGDCVESETTVSGTHAPRGKICKGDLIFEDNFDTFDLQKWQHEQTLAGGGNWEFQWYTNNRSNSYVEDGTLHIRPTFLADEYGEDFLYSGTLDINGGAPADVCTNALFYGCIRTGTQTNILNPLKSARLRTLHSFAFKYGKVEVRAKTPAGDWLWPAIWMMPRYNQYSSWPSSGEIDIMESRGNKQLVNSSNVNIGVQRAGSALHWGPNPNYNKFSQTTYDKILAEGYNNDFHKYQLEWTCDFIKFSYDDEVIGEIVPPEEGFWRMGDLDLSGLDNPWKRNSKMAPFDQEFYIILNLAVGGVNYFPDDATNIPGGKPWTNSANDALTSFWKGKDQWLPTWNITSEDTHLQVDYVKVWAN